MHEPLVRPLCALSRSLRTSFFFATFAFHVARVRDLCVHVPLPVTTPAQRFRSTRAAHRDETAEDYVEAIAQLAGAARVVELARLMGVSHVTVSRTVARLARAGLIMPAPPGAPVPRRVLTLTPKGQRIAHRIRQRHDDVFAFLLWLGVPRAQAEIDAEGIEHHVSTATIRAMRQLMARPATAKLPAR